MAGHRSKDSSSSLSAFDSEIPGSSYSLSFPSEPPDIRNWFSSYEYESPASDEDVDGKKDENLIRFEIIESRDVSDFCRIYYDNERHPVIKDAFEISNVQPYPKNLFLKRVRKEDESLQGDFKQKCDSSPLIDNKDSTVNNDSKDSIVNNVKSLERLEGSSEAKTDPFLSKNKENFSRVHEKLPAERDYGDSINYGKDEAKDITKSGFISTRNGKNTIENGGNFSNEIYIKSCEDPSARKHSTAIGGFKPLEKDAKLPEFGSAGHVRDGGVKNSGLILKKINGGSVGEERGRVGRKGLSEITNFQAESVPEIPGKWLCPRKNKPYIGPPLKQIRLERWVRRVQ